MIIDTLTHAGLLKFPEVMHNSTVVKKVGYAVGTCRRHGAVIFSECCSQISLRFSQDEKMQFLYLDETSLLLSVAL